MSLTVAIDVLFSVNFAVVFDFMYFRFCPSNAKLLGIVLPNRHNAAIRSMFFSSFIMSQSTFLGNARQTVKKASKILSEN
jgi:hypothetical protein